MGEWEKSVGDRDQEKTQLERQRQNRYTPLWASKCVCLQGRRASKTGASQDGLPRWMGRNKVAYMGIIKYFPIPNRATRYMDTTHTPGGRQRSVDGRRSVGAGACGT